MYVAGQCDAGAVIDTTPICSDPDSAFVVQLAATTGQVASSWFLGGPSSSVRARAISVDGAGQVIVAGDYMGGLSSSGCTLSSPSGADGRDLFVIKLGSNGECACSYTISGSSDDEIRAGTLTANGDLALAGRLFGSLSFPGVTFSAVGTGSEAFLAVLTP